MGRSVLELDAGSGMGAEDKAILNRGRKPLTAEELNGLCKSGHERREGHPVKFVRILSKSVSPTKKTAIMVGIKGTF